MSDLVSTTVTVETPLVPVFSATIGEMVTPVCDGRTLHAFLEVGALFANWIKALIEKYGFVENQDFALVLENPKTKTKQYSLSQGYK